MPWSAAPRRIRTKLCSSVRGLTKRFTATLALDRVDFDVRPGEIHALLGQNGAGKSTLIKILAGVYEADEGEIRLRGKRGSAGGERLPGVSSSTRISASSTGCRSPRTSPFRPAIRASGSA